MIFFLLNGFKMDFTFVSPWTQNIQLIDLNSLNTNKKTEILLLPTNDIIREVDLDK